jgi:hypothetical protein
MSFNFYGWWIPCDSLNWQFSSSISLSYVNPIFGFRGMLLYYFPFLFCGGHIPQQYPMVGGWNPPSSIPNLGYTFPGSSAQMGGPSTSYIPSIYPSSSMLVPTNNFIMVNLPMSSSVSYGGIQSYSMGNSLHRVPLSGGNIYPHTSNPCHVTFSSQVTSLVMMPLQTFMNQLGGGYYPTRKGHGVYQNPSWHMISQNQYFPGPWSQMSQSIVAIHVGNTSPVTASHTHIKSQTSASHVGDLKSTFVIHVRDLSLASTSHARDNQPDVAIPVGGTTLVIEQTSPISATHVGYALLAYSSHDGSMSLTTTSHSRGIYMIENPRRIGRKPNFLCRL